jgi:hypothetical protein
MTAQGNTLGNVENKIRRPEGAKQDGGFIKLNYHALSGRLAHFISQPKGVALGYPVAALQAAGCRCTPLAAELVRFR